jgi:hypothetical protein
MLRNAVAVHALPGHRLSVEFDDGVQGVVDVARLVRFTGVFERLQDQAFFADVTVHRELGVVYWPNGADLDSDVLHAQVAQAVDRPADRRP